MKTKQQERNAPSPTTEEGALSELGSMAWDLARQKLKDGTATSQLITFVLKESSQKEQLELEILRQQVELTKAKTEALKATKELETLYNDAMNAMKDYTGSGL